MKPFHVGQGTRYKLSRTLILLSPGISCLCHINFICTGSLWCTLYWLFLRYLYLIQLTDLSICEGTDTMKIRVSDQLGAMLYFPLDKSAEVFTSHPRTTVTARQEGSGPTHCNDRQLTLTIMSPLLMLTRAHPFSFHWEGMRSERWRKAEWKSGIKERGWLASSQGKNTDFWAPDSLPPWW